MKDLNFIDKVRSMSASEIIDIMIEGLLNPPVDCINMHTYGRVLKVYTDNYVCVGCVATIMIMKIGSFTRKDMIDKKIDESNLRFFEKEYERDFVSDFESAIDSLRKGNITYYNSIANILGIEPIYIEDFDLKLLKIIGQEHAADKSWDLDGYRLLSKHQENKPVLEA